MELEAKINELAKVAREHSSVLSTEEAAKNALVMPFLQTLGYNVFNPSEVVPEFTCDVGTKKGEKVDYAICNDGKVLMLIECKSVGSDLSVNHASQLYRYFSVTDARVGVLTNGVVYKFFSDIDVPNKMDEKPFFSLNLDSIKKSDFRILANFSKEAFEIENIVAAAGNLKMQSLVAKELEKEMEDPSEDFVRLIAGRVYTGRITSSVKENFKNLIANSFNSLVSSKVSDRLTSALNASDASGGEDRDGSPSNEDDGIITSQEEVDGFNIVRAICSRSVDPGRIVMRDAKSYCAILLDDNNRKTITRLHFNSPTARYIGCFVGKDEERFAVEGPTDIYRFDTKLLERVAELTDED